MQRPLHWWLPSYVIPGNYWIQLRAYQYWCLSITCKTTDELIQICHMLTSIYIKINEVFLHIQWFIFCTFMNPLNQISLIILLIGFHVFIDKTYLILYFLNWNNRQTLFLHMDWKPGLLTVNFSKVKYC